MSTKEEFLKVFKELFEKDSYELMEDLEQKPQYIGGYEVSQVEVLDYIEFDSYGSENSNLTRILNVPELNLYIKVIGTRCSYEGTEWNNFQETKQTQKTITVWN